MEIEDEMQLLSNAPTTVSKRACIKVRLFRNPRDYRTEYLTEAVISYNPDIGIVISDLKAILGSETIQVRPKRASD